jgi:hypothetical protein
MPGRPYRVGEIVMLEFRGWLKAFRVVGAHLEGETIEYQLEMVEQAGGPAWKQPKRG